ncbi:MAG: hypothetical protein LBI64_06270 [Coriobacteriales bacterium]|jgi:hypothetical protein|nr:hypothetical protein [Coriobacteriales bacterium]
MKKRFLAVVLALFAALALSLGLVACGGSSSGEGSFVGTYNLSSMTMQGITVEGSELNAALEAMGGADGNKLEVLDGQNLRMTFTGQAIELPYTVHGNVLNCSDASGSFDLVFEGDKVTWDVPESLAGAGYSFVMIFTRS